MPNSIMYISHGGGPLPLLSDPNHRELVGNLLELSSVVPKPSAIIVISAHWEEAVTTVTSGANPPLIYDYYGFPEESYSIQYRVPGYPGLAEEIIGLFKEYGIAAKSDPRRGFDHGLFVPLKIMYPEGVIPCIQVSLVKGLDPGKHIQIGKALSGLKQDNLLIVGSGFSFHNLNAFFLPPDNRSRSMNESFDNWLKETCTDLSLSEMDRETRMKEWESAPAARFCHPREEHLIPLHVCYGTARKPAQRFFSFEVMKKKASAFLWM